MSDLAPWAFSTMTDDHILESVKRWQERIEEYQRSIERRRILIAEGLRVLAERKRGGR